MVALDWKAWAALTIFVFQNAAMALLMRWNKSVAPVYSNSVAVLMQEGVVKLPLSFLLYAYDMGGAPLKNMMDDLKQRPDEWVKLSIPALLYTVQNIMLYVGYANLEAAVGMVTYQTKILFTAACSVLLLGKKLSTNQWCAVAILAVGIIFVQGVLDPKPAAPPTPSASAPAAASPRKANRHHKGHAHGRSLWEEMLDGRGLLEVSDAHTGSVPLGIIAMLVASACTSFASVYFEKMLKGASQPNLWLRNIQVCGLPPQPLPGLHTTPHPSDLRRPSLTNLCDCAPSARGVLVGHRSARNRLPARRGAQGQRLVPQLWLQRVAECVDERSWWAARRRHHQVRRQHPTRLRPSARYHHGRRRLALYLWFDVWALVRRRRGTGDRLRLPVWRAGQDAR